MNRNFRTVLVIATALTISLSACKKDDIESEVTASTEVEIPATFSTLTPEENKEQLEDNGVELVTEVESFKDAEGVATMSSFALYVSSFNQGYRTNKSSAFFETLKAYHDGKISTKRVLETLKSTETPSDLGAMLETYGGTYEWDSDEETFSFVEKTDGVASFKFPSTQGGSSNNAILKIHSYQGVTVNNQAAGINMELPTQLKMDLTVDGSKQIEYSMTASYNDQGEPTNAQVIWSINPFKLTIVGLNDTEEVGFSYNFTKSNKTLIAFGGGSEGDFDSEAFTQAASEDDLSKVINSAEAYFQLVNIKLAGKVDVASMSAGMTDDADASTEAELMNEHGVFVVYYADSKQKIADVEFYAKTFEESYESYEYNSETGQYEMVTYSDTYEGIAPRLIFADGSKADLETYVGTGFETLQAELENLVELLENMG